MKKLLTIVFVLLTTILHSQILLDKGWETGDILQSKFSPFSLAYTPYSGYPNGYSAQVSTDVARLGSKSLRLELRSTDSTVGGSKRAEIGIYTADTAFNNNARWFAWSEYLPSDYTSDTRNELHFQIHSTTSGYTGPNVALWLRNNRWYLNQKYNATGTNVEVQTELSNSIATLGGWTDWVVYFKPSITSDGEIKVWRNGSLVASVTGANANNVGGQVEAVRYPKWGVYKWPWATPGTYVPNKRVTYIDAVKCGGSQSTLQDFLIPNDLIINSFSPSSGTTNTQLTINGKGFTGTTSVSVGGVNASSYTVVNDSLLRAVVGNGATGKIVVNTASQSDTSTLNFTYISPTPPPPASQFVVRSDWDSTTDISQAGLYSLSSVCTIDGVTISQNASYSVPRSLMFRLRSTDPTCLSSKRSQIHISSSNNFLDTVEKYQFALYYPTSFVSDSREESHFTIHFGAITNTPTVQLLVVNDKIYLRQTFDSSCSAPLTRTFFLANVVRNQWVVWTFDFVRNSTSRGILRVYRNKTKVFERFAPNINGTSCSAGTRPIPAFGIVKSPWLTTGRYTPSSRLIYLDAVKLAGRSTSITTMLNQVK